MDATTSELILFANDYQRITGQCTLSSGCDVNDVGQQFTGGQALIVGAETMFRREQWLANGWKVPVQLQYSYTQATFQDNFYSGFPQFGEVSVGDRLPYVAPHQGSLSVGVETDNISIQTLGNYRGQMLDRASTWDDRDSLIPSLFTLDLSGNWMLGEAWQVYGTWNNLTNTQAVTSWRPFGARPVTPTSLFVGVKRAL